LFVAKAGHIKRADFREIHLAISIDDDADVEIDRTPGADEELVARAEHVLCAHRDAVDGGEGGGHILKELAAEDREGLADGRFDQFYKLGGWGCGVA
jgi:hypothetical protein